MTDDETKNMKYVPAIVIGGEATPKQRARNYAFYQRIRDGVLGDYRQSGLKSFVFEVPLESCAVGPASPSTGGKSMLSFRLDPASDCYRRLVSYVVGHTDAKCDADELVERMLAKLLKACDIHDAINGNDAHDGTTLELAAARAGAARAWFDELRVQVEAAMSKAGR